MKKITSYVFVIAFAGALISAGDAAGQSGKLSDDEPTISERSTDAVRSRIGHQDHFKDAKKAPEVADVSSQQARFDYAKSLLAEVAEGKPTLVFLHSTGNVDRDHPLYHRLATVNGASKLAHQTVFHTRSAFEDRMTLFRRPNTENDFRVAIASKYFNCVSVNLLEGLAQLSKAPSHTKVPMVVVFNAKGEVVGIFTSSKLRAHRIFDAMSAVMVDMGHQDFAEQVAEASEILNNIYRAEIELAQVTEGQDTLADRAKAKQLRAAIKVHEAKYTAILDAIMPAPSAE